MGSPDRALHKLDKPWGSVKTPGMVGCCFSLYLVLQINGIDGLAGTSGGQGVHSRHGDSSRNVILSTL